jgi:creatinine amidohydrolase/Fe(II)-dependent formamide hydrolase-like protein
MPDRLPHPGGEPSFMSEPILESLNIEELISLRPSLAVLPVVATEPQGPHLPYGAPALVCRAVCDRAAGKAADRGAAPVRLPLLSYAVNADARAFPMAVGLRVSTFVQVLLDLIEAIEHESIRKVVIVHVQLRAEPIVQTALHAHFERCGSDPRSRRAFVTQVDPFRLAASASAPGSATAAADANTRPEHAGRDLSSCMLALAPEQVDTRRLADQPGPKPAIETVTRDGVGCVLPAHRAAPRAAAGRISEASAEQGAALIEGAVKALADLIHQLSRTEPHPDLPYPQA